MVRQSCGWVAILISPDIAGRTGNSITSMPAYAILAWEGGSMIDPIQLPILMKAVDFVFDEGRKILEERRERRKQNDNAPHVQESQTATEIVPLEPEKAREVKQDLTGSKIDELLWQDHQWFVENLVGRLEDLNKSYYILKGQYEKFGSALVPPHIVLGMEEKEKSIIVTIKELETVLSKVYKKDINLVK